MKKFIAGAVSALVLSGHGAIAAGTVEGWYGGLMAGVSYTPSITTNVISPFSFPLPVIVPATIDYSVGGGGGIQLGYRWKYFRGEAELVGNYNAVNKLTIPGLIINKKSNRIPQTLAIKGDSFLGAGFINGYFDLNSNQEVGGWSPYVGLGIGYARVSTTVTYWVATGGSVYADTKLYNAIQETSTHPAGQVIIGISYALDSYTSIALDGRYITTASSNKNNNNSNNKYDAGMINILFNASFDGIINGK